MRKNAGSIREEIHGCLRDHALKILYITCILLSTESATSIPDLGELSNNDIESPPHLAPHITRNLDHTECVGR